MWLLPNFKRKVSKCCNNNNNGSLWQICCRPKSKLSREFTKKIVIFHVIHDEKIELDLKIFLNEV
jgi:hypothetical protein